MRAYVIVVVVFVIKLVNAKSAGISAYGVDALLLRRGGMKIWLKLLKIWLFPFRSSTRLHKFHP